MLRGAGKDALNLTDIFDFGMSWILHCIIFYMFVLAHQYDSGPPLFYFV